MSENIGALILLAELVEELIENLYSAWHEGASDCHTAGEDDHWPTTDAHLEGEMAKARLNSLKEQLGL